MSYTIYYEFDSKLEGKDYRNLTWDVLSGDCDKLVETEEFDRFYENYKGEVIEPDDKTAYIEKFMESDEYGNLLDKYEPVYNYVYVLQKKPTKKQIRFVYNLAEKCIILYIKEFDIYVIALTSVGTDLSDEIELAYYLTDGVSPVKAKQIINLNKKGAKLLKYCRKVVEEKGKVTVNDIEKFIEENREEYILLIDWNKRYQIPDWLL